MVIIQSSVTIKKTGKQVDLGLLTFISALWVRFYEWKFLETFIKLSLFVLCGSSVKKLTHSKEKLVYTSLVGSVTIANGQIEWSWSTNFSSIQDGAWLKPSCV